MAGVPSYVPPQYRGWVSSAARATGLSPSLVAAQIRDESGFNPRATSPTGAQGIAQFEPSTWSSYGHGSAYDPNAALGAYVKLMGALVHQYGGNVRNALAAYNAGPGNLGAGYGYADSILRAAGSGAGAASTGTVPLPSGATSYKSQPLTSNVPLGSTTNVKAATQAALKSEMFKPINVSGKVNLSSGSDFLTKLLYNLNSGQYDSAPASMSFTSPNVVGVHGAPGARPGAGMPPGHYVNPLQGAHWERTDMGVDASMAPGAPIRALGNMKVLGISPNWYQGQPYVAFRILDGPQKGRVVYYAEQISPRVSPGQTVRAGQVIGVVAGHGTGLELGYANPSNWAQTLAQATTGYHEGQVTPAGSAFRNLLRSTGAKA